MGQYGHWGKSSGYHTGVADLWHRDYHKDDLWHDWTGTEWCTVSMMETDETDLRMMETDETDCLPCVGWFNPKTGKSYSGPLDYRGCPKPEGKNITPWRWQKDRSKMDCVVDGDGHLTSVFAPAAGPDWKDFVRVAMCKLLWMVDEKLHPKRPKLARQRVQATLDAAARIHERSKADGASAEATEESFAPDLSQRIPMRRMKLGVVWGKQAL